MDNEVDAVLLACRGTLVGWSTAIESVAYEQARRNGESPLDRGAALRRRIERLSVAAPGPRSLAAGFDALAAERGWRRALPGAACVDRVLGLVRPYEDVAPALELAHASGRPLIVVSSADRVLVEGALRPLDGAFDAVLTADALGCTDPDALPAAAARVAGGDPRRLMLVSASRSAIDRARDLGMRCGWVNRRAGRSGPGRTPEPWAEEWPTLGRLPEFLGVVSQTHAVAG
jgi:FMN phosphatase YigB (HAD superfamily)